MIPEAPAASLDVRSRSREDVKPVSLERFVDEIAPMISPENGGLAAAAQATLDLPPLILQVGSYSCTIDKGSVRSGADPNGLVLEAQPQPMSDLLNGVRSLHGLVLGGDTRNSNGQIESFLAWDHPLQALIDGRPLYEAGTLTFSNREGDPLDLDRAFTPADDNHDISEFLLQAGFCRLSGWVDPGVLPAIHADVLEAAQQSNPGDPYRWWATLEDGTERCVRVMYLTEVSPTMAELVHGEAYERLGTLFGDGHCIRLERPQASEALIKPLRVKSGLTDFPWHRDCSLGGHAYGCAGYAIGLPLSATGGGDGYLRVVAGSHRVSVPAPGLIKDFDSGLPELTLATQPGDLTVHVSCTFHGTKAPKDRERVSTYTSYSLDE